MGRGGLDLSRLGHLTQLADHVTSFVACGIALLNPPAHPETADFEILEYQTRSGNCKKAAIYKWVANVEAGVHAPITGFMLIPPYVT